jgi:arylsulfatase A-like enzyme
MECHERQVLTPDKLDSVPPGPLHEIVRDPSAVSDADRYDGAILNADRNFGNVMNLLRDRGLADKTLVVVMADHGEALGEHEDPGHGMNPYIDQIHIPMVMRWPARFPAGRTVNENIQILDLAPTFLDAAHCTPPSYYSGWSLLPLVRGEGIERFASRPIFSYIGLAPVRTAPESVVMGDWYLLMELFSLQPHLYNLAADPAAQVDLIRENRDRFVDMYVRAAHHYEDQMKLRAALSPVVKPQNIQKMNPETEAQLKGLGYDLDLRKAGGAR